MKLFISALVAAIVSLTLVGCGPSLKPPPNISTDAVHAWYGTQVIKNLDRVRDAVDDAHKTTPPLISAEDELKIVNWHRSALAIVHAATSGWQQALDASITELQKNIPAKTWQLIAPYIATVQTVIKQL